MFRCRILKFNFEVSIHLDTLNYTHGYFIHLYPTRYFKLHKILIVRLKWKSAGETAKKQLIFVEKLRNSPKKIIANLDEMKHTMLL